MHKRRRGTAIVDTPNGILVVSVGGRTYYLPGGGARRGESRRKAAIRELKEETGLIADDCSYLLEYASHSNYHKIFLIKGIGEPKPLHEIRHIAYFNPENPKIHASASTRKIIELYFGIRRECSN